MNESKRIVFLDYVRVFACFLVMLVHASENFYPGPGATDMAGPQSFLANETDRLFVSLYDGFSRMAVPLFMIVSAFLLAPMKKGMSAKEFYKRRFTKIVPPFILFAVLYSTLPLLWGQIDIQTSVRDLTHIPLNFPSLAGHLWFIFPLLSLYLFIPVISPWLEKVGKREERFFIILFLISTCIPYLNRWFGEVWGQCFWNQYHLLWYFSGFLGYLVMAHYIRVHLDWDSRKKMTIGAVLMTVGAIVTILSFYVQATPGIVISTPVLEVGWNFCTINVACLTAGTFLMFSCIKRTEAPKIITRLSKLSYGMYLMHIFWLHLWSVVSIQTLQLHTAAAIPFIAVCTFVCCALTSELLSRLPGSKWIIGV